MLVDDDCFHDGHLAGMLDQLQACLTEHLSRKRSKSGSLAARPPLDGVTSWPGPDLLRTVDAHLRVQLDGVARGLVVADRHAGDVTAQIAVAADAEGSGAPTGCLRRLRVVG